MRFRFNERKTAQAAAYMLRKRGNSRTYGELIKLLYLSDRKAILDRGLPITGDRLVSMPHGPVLGTTYTIVCEGQTDGLGQAWHQYISAPTEYRVRALNQFHDKEDVDELSRYEIAVLDEIDDQFGHMTFAALREFTHELPEWEDPHGSSRPILPEEILRSASRSQEQIDQVDADAEELWYMGALASRR